MLSVKRSATVAVVCAAAAVAAPTAQAGGDSVLAALKAQQKVIFASPVVKLLRSDPHFKTAAQAKPFVAKFAVLDRLIEHASIVVGNASPTTSTQKQAQQKIVTGLRNEASGFGTVGAGLKQYVAGNKTAGKARILKGEKAVKAADVLEQSGVKMLGGAAS